MKWNNIKWNKKNQHVMIILLLLVLLTLLSVLLYVMFQKDHLHSRNQAEPNNQNQSDSFEETEQTDSLDDQIASLIQNMSIEEKAAQLFFITPESLTGVDKATLAGDTTKQALEQYPVGGLIYFSQNILNEKQITDMVSNTQSYSKIPLFIGIDEEGGTSVARIANNPDFPVTDFPDMAEIGATGDSSKAYEVGSTIGAYLKQYGFNLDFAPDADVLTNPDNTVIGKRSFGNDPSLVADMTAQEVKGLQEQGVSAVLKHFPGHGGTAEDTHHGAAVLDRSLDQLKENEFLPFQSGIEAGADAVMIGHLQVPQVISDDTPASLSSEIITDILREDLQFDGIVITDSLSMEAITKYYSSEEAAVMCIQAGADMILMPEDFQAAYQGILNAVENGSITEDRINESLTRIFKVKYR